MSRTLTAPFPYFGGKSMIAGEVWARFGDVPNYVEPFCGSCAVLLSRPTTPKTETVNDIDGYIVNFWRAVQHDADAVARYADWPLFENDLHARHAWLKPQMQSLRSRLEGDPEWYDAKIAGWWCWCVSVSIANTLAEPGRWKSIDGHLIRTTGHDGIRRSRPCLSHKSGVLSARVKADIQGYMTALAERLRNVRVCCGDWRRVTTPFVTYRQGVTAVFLDPPYGSGDRDDELYVHDSRTLAQDVWEWAVANGDNPHLRIAVCGYDDHITPPGWECLPWTANGGMANRKNSKRGQNRFRERIWFSPHCIRVELLGLHS